MITSFRAAEAEPPPTGAAIPKLPPSAIGAPGGSRLPTDHLPARESAYPSFGSQVGRIKWETAAAFGYFTAINSRKLFRDTTSLHFKNEGWFGRKADNLGVDKLTHAFDAYILAELLHTRLHKKTGGVSGDALTAALLASGLAAHWD